MKGSFMGGLPLSRSESEPHPDFFPRGASTKPLPPGDAKPNFNRSQSVQRAETPSQPLQSGKRTGQQVKSKAAKPAPKKIRVNSSNDEKPHAGAIDLDYERGSKPASPEDASEHESDDPFTIYDAVAGRLGYEGLVKPNQQPVSAVEYLFRYQKGPQQDQNYEQFSAHRHLEHRLPNSDLLKAIHAHASDFYGAMPGAEDSFQSLDETALIAMGILLEELTAEHLGETGDLAFVEAAQPGEADVPKTSGRKIKRQKLEHEGGVKVERNIKAESGSSDEDASMDDRGRSSGQKRPRGARADESDVATGDDEEQTDDDPSHNSEVESWISQTLVESQGEPTDLPIR